MSEYTAVDKQYVDDADAAVLDAAKAYTDAMIAANKPKPPEPEPEPGIVLGAAVYDEATTAQWSVDNPQFGRLASSAFGRDAVVPPTIPTHANHAPMSDASLYAKCRSALFVASQDEQYRDEAWQRLDGFANMDLVWSGDEDSRLSLSWAAINVTVAAKLSGYDLNKLEAWLRYVYPYMDWTSGVNWFASMFAARLLTGSVLDDRALYDEGKQYGFDRMQVSTFHRVYDGDTIRPLRGDAFWPQTDNEAPNKSRTEAHWNYQAVGPDYRAEFRGVPFIDGVEGERMRDLSHPCMSIAAWCDALQTIRAVGDEVPQEFHDRLATVIESHGSRVLGYLQTGQVPPPTPNAIGNNMRLYGWCKANRYLGAQSSSTVRSLLQRSEVRNAGASGSLFISGEAFADLMP